MARDTVLDVVERELAEAGIAYTVIDNSKHYKVLFNIAGKPLMIVVARTASDHRAAQNMRSLVRRTIKQALYE